MKILIKYSKFCRVCGDLAYCYNFKALSCEACKTFFRRSIIKDVTYKCRGELKCVVNKSTRNECKRCRLDKCYQIGMKKEMVHARASLDDQLPTNVTEKLGPYDLHRIGEIQRAMQNFPNEASARLIGESNDLVCIANLGEYYVRNTIKFCKQIDAFKQFQPSDQLTVLREFYQALFIVYISFLYDKQTNGLKIIANAVRDKAIYFKLDLLPQDTARQLAQFFSHMNEAMNNDVIIRDLIIAQLLFKPRVGINCLEFVKYNFATYGELLSKYLTLKFGCKAEKRMDFLVSALEKLDTTNFTLQTLYHSEIDIKVVNPILIEIYNLQ